MILIKPSYEIKAINGGNLLLMEEAGRNCYKSESKGNPASFLASKIKSKHLTIIEHGSMTVKFIVDRGFTHELVRHRMAVYSQESTRYCNYSGGVTFVIPPWLSNVNEGTYNWPEQQPCKSGEGSYEMTVWLSALKSCECTYLELLKSGWSPQQARTVLPNSLKTEIYMTANFREWRLIFEQRALGLTGKPHPQMEEIMIPLMNEMKKELPAIFGDLGENV